MKHIHLRTPLFIIATLLVSCGGKKAETSPLSVPDFIPVKVASLSSLTLSDTVCATGLISTEDEARYSFKIGGVINRIFVEEGQFFTKGQLLATLNATEISAGLSQSDLNVEKTQRDYDRALHLYKDSVYTLEQLQNSKTALDVAIKGREAVAFNEHYSKIYATADGFVTQKLSNEGEVVAAGIPVLSINETIRNSNYLLKVGLTDKEWAAVTLGQKAIVTLDGYPGQQFDAFIFRKSQASDKTLGSFQIELKLRLSSIHPAVGMFGKATIQLNRKNNVLSLPYDALVEVDGNKAFVFTPLGTARVRRIPVTISKFDNHQAYISSGLEGVNAIVISNSAWLNEQSSIKIIR